jgi:hypothetical protein
LENLIVRSEWSKLIVPLRVPLKVRVVEAPDELSLIFKLRVKGVLYTSGLASSAELLGITTARGIEPDEPPTAAEAPPGA